MTDDAKKETAPSRTASKSAPRAAPRGEETRTLILDTAEAMFLEQGYSAVTMRALTARAGVNLAAVNYHFGSKDALLLEVFRRGSLAINRERARLLREAETRAGSDPVPLREILHALFAPAVRSTFDEQTPIGGSSIYVQFVARASLDGPPEMRAMIEGDVRHLERFIAALSCALPGLSHTELLWRFHFAMGTLHSIYNNLRRLESLAKGDIDLTDADAITARVVEFAAAGMEST
jgi:AcrR family transcriptional regulator